MKTAHFVILTSGLILLCGYVLFDSFTSNWQGELFSQYKMTSFQMMCGVNFFSIIFCGVSLIEQGGLLGIEWVKGYGMAFGKDILRLNLSGFLESISFMMRHPQFLYHVLLLSSCGAGGQLFIFHTIAAFGPVTFTIIMAIRQGKLPGGE